MEVARRLAEDLGVTAMQAEGGAGLLLGFAEQRLSAEEFARVADTIPAISDVIGKAPRWEIRPASPLRESISRWFGGLGGLAGLVEGFEKLGCEKAMIVDFVNALVEFFREQGGDEIAALLRGVLR